MVSALIRAECRRERHEVPACSRIEVTDSESGCERKDTRMLLGDTMRKTHEQDWELEVWRQSLRDHLFSRFM